MGGREIVQGIWCVTASMRKTGRFGIEKTSLEDSIARVLYIMNLGNLIRTITLTRGTEEAYGTYPDCLIGGRGKILYGAVDAKQQKRHNVTVGLCLELLQKDARLPRVTPKKQNIRFRLKKQAVVSKHS